jgi:D-glycero-alpha-D-manno-heptose-7-phosphate kinase
MIITRTPFRISFVGGGSDLGAYYRKQRGAVLSTTIDKYMYISSHTFFEHDKVRIKYSKTETHQSVDDIEHPIVKEVLKKFDVKGGLEISSIADVPAGTGLGSSSSYTVGLLHNMYTKFNKFVTKEHLADEACTIEIEKLGEPIGKQDQYAAAYGGLNVIAFNPNESVDVEAIHLKRSTCDALEGNLMMFYTGMQRKTASILTEQRTNMGSEEKFRTLGTMVDLVWDLRDALYANDLTSFGDLLHKNWLLKKQLASKISNPELNSMYDRARGAGALGGKILGAGGGGFLLVYCEEEHQENVRKALSPMRSFDFGFDREGSKLIYVGDEYE